MRSVIVILLLAFWALSRAAAPPAAGTPLPEGRIRELIRQLGSDVYKEREEATRMLRDRQEAESVLRGALRSSDAEVVRRVRALLDGFVRQRRAQALARIKAAAKEGEADLLAEELVQWPGEDDAEECWQPLIDFSHRLIDFEHDKFRRIGMWRGEYVKAFIRTSFRPYMTGLRPKALPAGRPDVEVVKSEYGKYLARGEHVDIKKAHYCLLAGSRLVRDAHLESSFVLSGGNVEIADGSWLVVVCDGDFVGKKVHGNSLIVARGSVRCANTLHDMVILAGGDVSFSEGIRMLDVTVRAAGTVSLPKKKNLRNCDLKGGVPDALRLARVKFFEPSSLGVAVAASNDEVRVKVAAADKPFALAGLRIGDVILALDGSPVRTPEAFRRLLRKRLVQGGAALLKVRRGERSIDLRVPRLR
jgi:hypothetical protein